jgi:hypothetical protein
MIRYSDSGGYLISRVIGKFSCRGESKEKEVAGFSLFLVRVVPADVTWARPIDDCAS